MSMTEAEIIKLLKQNEDVAFRDLPQEAQEWAREHHAEIWLHYGNTNIGEDENGALFAFEPDDDVSIFRLRADYPEPEEIELVTEAQERAELIEEGKENEQAWKYLQRDRPDLAAVMESVAIERLVVLGKTGGWWTLFNWSKVYPRSILRIHKDYTEPPKDPAPTVEDIERAYKELKAAQEQYNQIVGRFMGSMRESNG
jgi:hypothetical protein